MMKRVLKVSMMTLTGIFMLFSLSCNGLLTDSSSTTVDNPSSSQTNAGEETSNNETQTTENEYAYHIIFESNEGNSIDSLFLNDVNHSQLPLPIKEGYFFLGWYMDGSLITPFSETDLVEGENILYAKWVPEEKYTLNLIKAVDINDHSSFIDLTSNGSQSMALSIDNKVYLWGYNYPTAIDITDDFSLNEDEYIIDIASGSYHQVFLTNTGRVFGSGSNNVYQIGSDINAGSQPTDFTDDIELVEDEKIIRIEAHKSTTLIITNKNRILRLGNGINDFDDNQSFMTYDITQNINLDLDDSIKDIYYRFTGNFLMLTEMGRVFVYKSNGIEHLLEIDTTNLTEITHVFNLSDNEKVVHMEKNLFYTSQDRLLLLNAHDAFFGQRDNESKIIDVTNMVGLGEGEAIINMLTNNFGSLYVSTTHQRVLYFGVKTDLIQNIENSMDTYIGLDLTNTFKLKQDEYILEFFDEFEMGSLLTSEGNILTWGPNQDTLGDYLDDKDFYYQYINDYIDKGEDDEILEAIYGGYRNTNGLAYTENNRIFVWGDNESGLLGYGNNTYVSLKPYEITDLFNFEEDEHILKIDMHFHQALLVTDKGRIFSWGTSNSVILSSDESEGLHDIANISEISHYFNLEEGEIINDVFASGPYSLFMSNHNNLFYAGQGTRVPSKMDDYHDLVDEGERILEVTSFESNMIIRTNHNRVLTYGSNLLGELGNGTRENYDGLYDLTQHIVLEDNENIIDIEYIDGFSLFLTSLGKTYVWGKNQSSYVNIEEDFILTPILFSFDTLFDSNKIINIEIMDSAFYILTEDHTVYLYNFRRRSSLLDSRYLFSIGESNYFYRIDTDFLLEGATIISLDSSFWNIYIETDNGFYSFGSDMVEAKKDDTIEIFHSPLIVFEENIVYNYLEKLDAQYMYYLDGNFSRLYENDFMPREDISLFVKEDSQNE